MSKALIIGISGQDGSYLAEYLISIGYNVYGIVRRNSVPENQWCRLDNDSNKIKTFYGDLLDQHSLEHVLKTVMPDEIYNLAAQSHVRISFDIPQYTLMTNANGTLNLLEAYRNICPKAKFYQACSSEMFGNSYDVDGFQRLTTPMKPVSPYGCSKVLAYNICCNYRNAYGLHICNGILFNHESPRRGTNFVTNKVVKQAVRIKNKLDDKLVLGNLDSFRDWGHSKDYVVAMHKMLNYQTARDWIVCTGITHSVRELCQYVFNKLGLNYKDYVTQDQSLLRPEELRYLKGDCTETKKLLNWLPSYSFETLLDEMMEHWEKNTNK